MYDDITLFIRLAEVANYTKAASLLNTTQATLSRRIKNLEAELGINLIRRNSNTFELTEQGDLIYQQLVTPIKQLQVKLADFKESREIIQGTLKIALPAALAYEIITPKISQFTKQYPKVKLLITYTGNPIDLMRDDFNLAVSTLLPLSQNSLVRLIKKFSFKLYASPSYIKQYGIPHNLKELNRHQSLGMMDIDGNLRFSYKVTNLKTMADSIFNHEPNIYINNILHGIQLAKSGDYIIGGWDGLVAQELKSEALVPVLPDYIFGELPCYLIRHNHASLTKLEELFIEFLLACFTN